MEHYVILVQKDTLEIIAWHVQIVKMEIVLKEHQVEMNQHVIVILDLQENSVMNLPAVKSFQQH